MPNKRKPMDASADSDMTPMIDMTFQLIAFFMALITFSEDIQDQDIKLPSSQLAKPPSGPTELPITLQVTKDNLVLFNGDKYEVAAMRPHLLKEKQLLERDGKSAKEAHVIIRADARTTTGKVQELIKLCQDKALGFEQFSLRAKQDVPYY